MREHRLKLDIKCCQDVYDGLKTFEVRINDRDYQVGDIIRFRPVDYKAEFCHHEIENKTYQITYILDLRSIDCFIGLEDGWIVFSIKEIEICG
jgi:ASC-1-like (ASCH) protein